jgi:uncharacterized OsmC-like protein
MATEQESTARIRNSIEGAVCHLTAHPEESRGTDRAAVATLEKGLRCRIEGANDAQLASDMPKAVGGAGSAPTPGWLLRAALAGCDATVIAMRAARVGVHLDTLKVTVESESDDRGLLGMDDGIPAGPLSVRVRVHIAAHDIEPERLHAIVEWADRHSPVGDAIRRAVLMATEVEID